MVESLSLRGDLGLALLHFFHEGGTVGGEHDLINLLLQAGQLVVQVALDALLHSRQHSLLVLLLEAIILEQLLFIHQDFSLELVFLVLLCVVRHLLVLSDLGRLELDVLLEGGFHLTLLLQLQFFTVFDLLALEVFKDLPQALAVGGVSEAELTSVHVVLPRLSCGRSAEAGALTLLARANLRPLEGLLQNVDVLLLPVVFQALRSGQRLLTDWLLRISTVLLNLLHDVVLEILESLLVRLAMNFAAELVLGLRDHRILNPQV